jgi:Fic family protein
MRTDKFLAISDTFLSDERVTGNDLVVYVALLLFESYNEASPSIALIGKVARLSKNTTRTALNHLEELGYIEIERGKGRTKSKFTIIRGGE